MKYAVVENGGSQVMLKEGENVLVDDLDIQKGKKYTWDKVLLYRNGDELKVGAPHVKGMKVTGTVGDPAKGPKVVSYKKKRRKGYRRKVGHRQSYVEVLVEEIK